MEVRWFFVSWFGNEWIRGIVHGLRMIQEIDQRKTAELTLGSGEIGS
jgi:hypothetical protein